MKINPYVKEFKSLLRVSAPLVLAQLAQNTVSFVDTVMVGKLGNEALAGIALGSTVFHFVLIILSGVVLGVSPVVSQATGAGDDQTCGRAVRQALWLGLILFLPAFFLYRNAYPILIALGQPESTAADSAAYLKAISWGLLPALWVMGLRGLLEGKSNNRPIMLFAVSGVGLNIFANDTLMFGRYGLPEMGLVGTGYASSFVYFSVFAMIAIYASRCYRSLQIFSKIRTPDLAMLWELVRIGGPIGLTLAFEGGMFSAAAVAMGTLGKGPLAAHQIAVQTASISFMVPLGIAIATSVRVGNAIGARSVTQAQIAGRTGMATAVMVMCLSGVVFWCFPKLIIGLYIDLSDESNQAIIGLATSFLAIAAIFQIADGLQVAGSASLRGLKDTKAAMFLTLISYWGVGCISGWLLYAKFDLGGNGLWIGMTMGLATAAVLLPWRFQYRVKRIRREQENT